MAIQSNFQSIPKETLILGANKYFSTNGRKTHVNNNVLVCGRSGSGKSRYIVAPNLLQLNGSYVVSDPKGQLYKEYHRYFEENDYRVLHVNFQKPEQSTKYNPISKIQNTIDILKIAHAIIYRDENRGPDPFWDNNSVLLLSSLIGFVYESSNIPSEDKNMNTVQSFLGLCTRKRFHTHDKDYSSQMDALMDEHNEQMLFHYSKNSWAVEQYSKVANNPDKTFECILSCIFSKLACYNSESIQLFLSDDELDFKTIGQEPTILFVELSDTDRSLDKLVSLFFTQLIHELCSFADECQNGSLPIPVQLIMDDFATIVTICDFPSILSNIRSRDISAMLMVQDLSQLEATYGKNANTVISNCGSCLYLGASYDSASIFARWANEPIHRFLNHPLDAAWVFRTGQKPELVDFIDIDAFKLQKGLQSHKKAFEKEFQQKEDYE